MRRNSVLHKERDETLHIVAPVNTGAQSLPQHWELRHTTHHAMGRDRDWGISRGKHMKET
jgi:hypothetical protein